MNRICRIFLIRSQKIMLDSDLAKLYQVSTNAFNQAVKRNLDRFASDFMFRLSAEEMELLNLPQFVDEKPGTLIRYARRYARISIVKHFQAQPAAKPVSVPGFHETPSSILSLDNM
jgi:hypothetical protein